MYQAVENAQNNLYDTIKGMEDNNWEVPLAMQEHWDKLKDVKERYNHYLRFGE